MPRGFKGRGAWRAGVADQVDGDRVILMLGTDWSVAEGAADLGVHVDMSDDEAVELALELLDQAGKAGHPTADRMAFRLRDEWGLQP